MLSAVHFMLAVVGVTLVAAWFIWLLYDGLVRLPGRRTSWIARNPPANDADWQQQLNVPSSALPLSLLLRRSLAQCCKVPAETIRPDTLLRDLESQLTADGIDAIEIIMSLEDAFEVSIPDSVAERMPAPTPKFSTVAEWVRAFIDAWDKVQPQLRRSGQA